MQRVSIGTPLPLGMNQTISGVQFALHEIYAKRCSLLLFNPGEKLPIVTVDITEHRIGNVFSVCFQDKKITDFAGLEYLFEVDGKQIVDPYATKLAGCEHWGSNQNERQKRGVVCDQTFDWESDSSPNIAYSDLYLYQLHVRGYTKHSSSNVVHKGTFQGVTEKIPYIKELGMNALLLLPCYEFDEYDAKEDITKYEPIIRSNPKINYWGYANRAFYFAPKASFTSKNGNPQIEVKELIKKLHREKMEVLMDMFFPKGTNVSLIIDCLRHWKLNYHVDGFRVNDNVVPVEIISNDPILGCVKLLAASWSGEEQVVDTSDGSKHHSAEFNEGFLTDARRFLKGDEGQVRAFMHRMKKNPKNQAVINYITYVNGFTLMDLFSYDIKHNEPNGEQGRDGTDFNYSWNCGKEGETKKKQVLMIRNKQIKNALLMLYLSQGTPMLLAGDEFGNSQKGNNNPYCQDNAITWLNWNLIKANNDILEFVKKLVAFRKEHPILHKEEELTGMDYISCGSPDISFHGTKAWYIDDSNYSRLLSVMLNGDYQLLENGKKDDTFYIAFNMHWESHTFDLPMLSKTREWKLKWDTSKSVIEEDQLLNQRTYLVKPRTIVVLQGIICEK
ncbi:MAG: alpha-amylase family glycosyl hydrolase [Velocimicrobium sp.]